MAVRPNKQETWQVEFAEWDDMVEWGVQFTGARRLRNANISKGYNLERRMSGDEIPLYLREYCAIQKHGELWVCPFFHSLDELQKSPEVRWNERQHKGLVQGYVTVAVKVPDHHLDSLKQVLPDGVHGSHYGLTDLYPPFEQKVRQAVADKGDFRAKWASKKELASAEIVRAGSEVRVTVWISSDDDADLIQDALQSVAREADEPVRDGMEYLRKRSYPDLDTFLMKIKDRADMDLNGVVLGDPTFEASLSGRWIKYEKIMQIVSYCADLAEQHSQENFERLKLLSQEVLNGEDL